MPAKRKGTESEEDVSQPPSKQSSPSKPKNKWTHMEEDIFLAKIDGLCKKHLWAELKDDPIVSARGANGVRSHWDALYKKWMKDAHGAN